MTSKPTAAAFLVVSDIHGKHFFTIQRTDMRVGFVGGKMEVGETPRQAVVREFLEETNVQVAGDGIDYIGLWTLPDGRPVHYFYKKLSTDSILSLMVAAMGHSIRGMRGSCIQQNVVREIVGVNFTDIDTLLCNCEKTLMPTMAEVLLTIRNRGEV